MGLSVVLLAFETKKKMIYLNYCMQIVAEKKLFINCNDIKLLKKPIAGKSVPVAIIAYLIKFC